MSAAPPPQLLAVEDSEADILAVRRALRRWKGAAELRHAEDGEAALRHLDRVHQGNEPPPDLVLLDLNLGRVSGLEVLAQLKTDGALKRLPVVVLTSSLAATDVVAAYELGANAVVSKPLELADLYRTLSRLFDFWLLEVALPTRADRGGFRERA